jgi:putative endopeptidase
MRKLLILFAASTALAACTTAPSDQPETVAAAAAGPVAAPGSAAPQIGSFGFDLAGMDRSVEPGDNFYAFANGNWDRTTEIPADRSNYCFFTLVVYL